MHTDHLEGRNAVMHAAASGNIEVISYIMNFAFEFSLQYAENVIEKWRNTMGSSLTAAKGFNTKRTASNPAAANVEFLLQQNRTNKIPFDENILTMTPWSRKYSKSSTLLMHGRRSNRKNIVLTAAMRKAEEFVAYDMIGELQDFEFKRHWGMSLQQYSDMLDLKKGNKFKKKQLGAVLAIRE